MGYPNKAADETIRTRIDKISTYNPATGWFVGRAGSMNVVGVSPVKPPTGMSIILTGQWQNNATYGRQFRVSGIRYDGKTGAVLAMLKGGFLKHIKDAMAESVVETLGDDVFDVLNGALAGDSRSLAMFNSVKGIGKVIGPSVLKSWEKQRDWAENALICFRAGLTLRQAKLANDKYGSDLKRVICDNPYILTSIRGITWEVVDRIAQEEWPDKPAMAHDDVRRYAAAVRETLRRAYYEGHVCLARSAAFQGAIELAKPTVPAMLEPRVTEVADSEELIIGDWVYNKDEYGIETGIAARLRELSSARVKPIDWSAIDPSKYAPVELSPDQLVAVETAMRSSVMVMTGGPGVGKTTTICTIVNILSHYGHSLTLCAPTGKAAIRMSKATGFDASTIHRALGLPIKEADLMTDAVIVDEASMIDQDLMHKLVMHVKKGARLIFVGDPDQLPPVGAGEPFFQIVQSSIPVVRLTTIHRQGKDSGIIVAAHGFNRGEVPDMSEYEDCNVEYVGANEQLQRRAIEVYSGLLDQGVKQQDIILLTPLNRHDWGQQAINLALKAKYNPGLDSDRRMPLVSFDVYDPVIHTRNNYRLGVMNGEIGEVVFCMDKQGEMAAKLECDSGELPVIVKVKYDGKEIEYNRDDLADLKLAYSITIHKSQGSEAPVVIMVVPSTHEGFELRQLAYTGLTRAKKFAHVISCQNALQRYVGNTERVRRYTQLASFLDEVQERVQPDGVGV